MNFAAFVLQHSASAARSALLHLKSREAMSAATCTSWPDLPSESMREPSVPGRPSVPAASLARQATGNMTRDMTKEEAAKFAGGKMDEIHMAIEDDVTAVQKDPLFA
eukprot:448556-Prymnesium_polylepis.2